MTADQMPDEIKLGMAFTTKNNKRSCYVVGFVVGGNPLFRFDDDMSFSSLELSMVVRDAKHDICDFFPQNTRATPPKSQGVDDPDRCEHCGTKQMDWQNYERGLTQRIAGVQEWFFRWASRAYGQSVTPMEAIGVIFHHPENPYKDKNPWETNQDAPTRQHPTPAQAQGESVTVVDCGGDYCVRCVSHKCEHVAAHKAALSHAPEVVTVEEYLHGYLETVNKIGLDKNCAAYKFLMETNSRHTKYMQEKYPNGLIIKRTE